MPDDLKLTAIREYYQRRQSPLSANLLARSALASYPALCEPLDQERCDGNNDHGADNRANDATPVELVCVADAKYAVEDPVTGQRPQQAQYQGGQPRSY